MLGIDVKVEIKNPKFPIAFDFYEVNACVHCGAQDSIVIIDKFGHKTKEEIHPFDYMKCTKCNQVYAIEWIKNEKGEFHPYPSDPSIARQFFDVLCNRFVKRTK